MVAVAKKQWTVEEYLQFEAESPYKHEFIDGQIIMMAGASESHNTLVANLIASLHAQLRGTPCRVYPSDLRVRLGDSEEYYYPDVSVVCGTPEIIRTNQDTLLNPIVVIEVLSPSTEKRDRSVKFANYRTIDSLQEYLLVAQDHPLIEHYVRQSSDTWLFADANEMSARLTLTSINAVLTLADVYEKVDFQNAERDTDEPSEG
jgi:Uma2 family endonuclease